MSYAQFSIVSSLSPPLSGDRSKSSSNSRSSKYNNIYDWWSDFPQLENIKFFTVLDVSSAKYPLKLQIETRDYLQISKIQSNMFDSVSLFIPQDEDLQQNFHDWILKICILKITYYALNINYKGFEKNLKSVLHRS